MLLLLTLLNLIKQQVNNLVNIFLIFSDYLWKILSNGKGILGSTKPFVSEMTAKIGKVEYYNGIYTVSNISFNKIRSGIFYLVFIVQGIESQKSPAITIEALSSANSIFPSLAEMLTAVIAILLILAMNTVYMNGYMSFLAVFISALEILIVQQSDKGVTFQIVTFLVLGSLTIINGYMTFNELVYGPTIYFSNVRKRVFKKYTKQQLFGYIIKNSDGTHRKIPCNGTDGTSEIIPFKKRSYFNQFKSIFTPFAYEYNNRLRIQDAFYFPQRFIAAILLGILAFVYFCYNITTFFLSLFSK